MSSTDWPDPTFETADFLRRIHWWVRLFGIIWIVVPIILALFAGAFFLAAMAMGGT